MRRAILFAAAFALAALAMANTGTGGRPNGTGVPNGSVWNNDEGTCPVEVCVTPFGAGKNKRLVTFSDGSGTSQPVKASAPRGGGAGQSLRAKTPSGHAYSTGNFPGKNPDYGVFKDGSKMKPAASLKTHPNHYGSYLALLGSAPLPTFQGTAPDMAERDLGGGNMSVTSTGIPGDDTETVPLVVAGTGVLPPGATHETMIVLSPLESTPLSWSILDGLENLWDPLYSAP